MKRTLIALGLLLSLAACGGSGGSPGQPVPGGPRVDPTPPPAACTDSGRPVACPVPAPVTR